jgi:hypothetical protein
MCEQFVGDRIRDRPAGVRFQVADVAAAQGFERSVWDVVGQVLLPAGDSAIRLPYLCTVGHNDPDEWTLVGLCLREGLWAPYVHRSLHSSDDCRDPAWTIPGDR